MKVYRIEFQRRIDFGHWTTVTSYNAMEEMMNEVTVPMVSARASEFYERVCCGFLTKEQAQKYGLFFGNFGWGIWETAETFTYEEFNPLVEIQFRISEISPKIQDFKGIPFEKVTKYLSENL